MSKLADKKIKALRPKDNDYVITAGSGLQLRVRANRSRLWSFN